MIRQAVIFIHGVGDQRDGYSHQCMKLIDNCTLKCITKEKHDTNSTDITYREVWWAPITAKAQTNLWSRVNKTHDLDMVKLRKFMVDFAGDAIAYQRGGNGHRTYDEIHNEVKKEVHFVKNEFPDDQIEFTFVAHSMGSVIASNYLYDERKDIRATNLFTMGSPLAIWTLAQGDVAVANEPVQVSRPHGTWINILDDEDIIAYPLRDINREYMNAVDKDLVTEIGGLMHRGPVSHAGYWTDDNVTKPIGIKLAMDYLRIHRSAPYRKHAYLAALERLWNV